MSSLISSPFAVVWHELPELSSIEANIDPSSQDLCVQKLTLSFLPTAAALPQLAHWMPAAVFEPFRVWIQEQMNAAGNGKPLQPDFGAVVIESQSLLAAGMLLSVQTASLEIPDTDLYDHEDIMPVTVRFRGFRQMETNRIKRPAKRMTIERVAKKLTTTVSDLSLSDLRRMSVCRLPDITESASSEARWEGNKTRIGL